MFGFKKKSVPKELVAVVDGTLIPIEEVKDPVFSQKMMAMRSSRAETLSALARTEKLQWYFQVVMQ